MENSYDYNKAVEKLSDTMLEARKNYVKTMFYRAAEHIEINNVSYIQIPCTESYIDTYNDYGIIKTEKLGAFVIGEYVEIEYGYINKEISYVDNEYVKNSEIKFVG